jgi:hypothetical protein
MVVRSPEQIARFFDGLEIVEPGVGPLTKWRPDPEASDAAVDVDEFCAVGRKP